MAVSIRDFLKARRDRALASILGYAERNVWGHLEQDAQRAMRSVVVDAINSYHDSVLDLVKADTTIRNEEAVDVLAQNEGLPVKRRG